MVFGLLLLTAIPTSIGTVTALGNADGGEDEVARDDKRGEECTLVIHCAAPSLKRKRIHGKSVILKDDKVMIDFRPQREDWAMKGHPFKGFCIGFPTGEQLRGLVSFSGVDPPSMGWLYADKDTLEMKYGNKTTSTPHIYGPWDLTEDDEGLLLQGEELFVAVEEKEGQWALYYDKQGDGTGLPEGKAILPVSIERKPVELLDMS